MYIKGLTLILLISLEVHSFSLSYKERQEIIKVIGEKKLSALEWLSEYYKESNVEEIPDQIVKMSKAGLLKSEGVYSHIIFGFITGLLRQHDTLIQDWTKTFRWLPRTSKDFISVCMNIAGSSEVSVNGKFLEEPRKKRILLKRIYFDNCSNYSHSNYIYDWHEDSLLFGLIEFRCGEFYATGSYESLNEISKFLKYVDLYKHRQDKTIDWSDPINIVCLHLYNKAYGILSDICSEGLGKRRCEEIVKNSGTDYVVRDVLNKILKK